MKHKQIILKLNKIILYYPFVTGGESSGGRQTRNGVAVCSQKRALLVAGIVLGSLLLTALIIAYAGPSNGKRFFISVYYY